ncbi:hypothetical protein GGI26_003282 [Coemansia sp. RSA 1358]|nr:hypothetical protein GGI26_003282 [Coemansia sp. RSA 1358]
MSNSEPLRPVESSLHGLQISDASHPPTTPSRLSRPISMSHGSTPSRRHETNVTIIGSADDANNKLKQRRIAIGKSIEPRLTTVTSVSSILGMVGLNKQYEDYKKAAKGTFRDIAEHAFSGLGINEQNTSRNPERRLAGRFSNLFAQIKAKAAASFDSGFSKHGYYLVDYQDSAVDGSKIKPDFVYYFAQRSQDFETAHIVVEVKPKKFAANPPPEVLGQLGDYALSIWSKQPLRTFVPVILMHGYYLELYIFGRGKVYHTEFGKIGPSNRVTSRCQEINGIEKTIENLWFLLALSTESLGHSCKVDRKQLGIRVLKDVSGAITSIELANPSEDKDAMILLDHRIPKTVHLFGRAAYLFRSMYNGKKAVIKISWTPTDRLPECAVYEALHAANIPNVPEVHEHGFIKGDFLGYRMEFIVLADCGDPISVYFAQSCTEKRPAFYAAQLAQHTKSIANTLVHAYKAGILHRDVSVGNITVSGNRVYMIDWGYAKFLPWACIDEIATKWNFDKNEVLLNETQHNSITGTPIFMSIQTLLGSNMRDITHDFESLFLVAMYSLVMLSGNMNRIDDPDYGWCSFGTAIDARFRLGSLCSMKMYLENFGCGYCPDSLRSMLDGMYQFLFMESNSYIGGKLMSDRDYARQYDFDSAACFLGPPECDILYELVTSVAQSVLTEQASSSSPSPYSRGSHSPVHHAQPSELTNIRASPPNHPAATTGNRRGNTTAQKQRGTRQQLVCSDKAPRPTTRAPLVQRTSNVIRTQTSMRVENAPVVSHRAGLIRISAQLAARRENATHHPYATG